MKVLVLGGSGMLGHKVFSELSGGHEAFATFHSSSDSSRGFPIYAATPPDHLLSDVNAMDFDTVVRAVGCARPDVVVNCIGVVKQLKQSKDPIVSIALNALFPHRLAALCEAAQARLIHISTDCVFSGRRGGYTENDASDAEDLYGRTKFLGEVTQSGCLTLRTSIIGRELSRASGLLEWFLTQRGSTVRGYRNAIYTGVTTQALASLILEIIERFPELSGVYQIASKPISKYALLVHARTVLGVPVEILPDDDFRCDRSLSAERFVTATRLQIPSWDDMLSGLALEVGEYEVWRRNYAAT